MGEKVSIASGAPAVGEVVTFESTESPSTTLVKRVVADVGKPWTSGMGDYGWMASLWTSPMRLGARRQCQTQASRIRMWWTRVASG